MVTVVLADLGDGRTEMRFEQRGHRKTAEQYERSAESGWGMFLRRHRGRSTCPTPDVPAPLAGGSPTRTLPSDAPPCWGAPLALRRLLAPGAGPSELLLVFVGLLTQPCE